MTVRKKQEGTDVFEDVVKVPDKVEQFTIAQIDVQIANINRRITEMETQKETLEVRKTAALALDK